MSASGSGRGGYNGRPTGPNNQRPGPGPNNQRPGPGPNFRPGPGPNPNADVPMPQAVPQKPLVQQQMSRGKAGQPVELVANFYKFVTSDVVVFHYDIDITREKRAKTDSAKKDDSNSRGSSPTASESEEMAANLERFIKKFSPAIVQKFIDTQAGLFRGVRYVYDGFKNLYTVRMLDLPGKSKEMISKVAIDVDNRPAEFNIKIKLVDRVAVNEVLEYYSGKRQDLSERTISIYEIVFRFIMGQQYECFQRKFFDLKSVQSSPKVQLADFVSGFTSAVRMTEFGLALNLHLKTSCIVSHNIVKLTDLVAQVANIRPGQKPHRNQIVDANKMIRHLRMFTEHSNKKVTYTMDGLIEKNPYELNFKNKNGQNTSIAQYFAKEYKIEVQKLPLVKTTGKMARYIPMELCSLVPNQFLSNAKINSSIQRELLFKSTHTPNVYFNKLNTIVSKVAGCDQELQKQFGIELSTKPVSFQARVLPTPRQLCGDNRGKFFKPSQAPPARWAVFCLDNQVNQEDLNGFVKQMMDRANFFGLRLAQPNPVTKVDIKDSGMLVNLFHNLQKRTHAQFVFIGIPSRHPGVPPASMYSLTKYLCDQKYGIVTQCFKTDNITRTPGGYFDNFLLKVNGKMCGLNSVIDPSILKTLPFDTSKTMMIGIDVNHPSETERIASSVSAAVGSIDPMFSSYTASIRVQKKERDEMVKHIDQMIVELMDQFKKANREYPRNLVIFRDGISEGQYEKVLKTEMPMVQAGLNKLGLKTAITLIVVQKTHNTRFALTKANTQGRKPTFNVPSGTVVDNTIVEPLYKMFYLNSHFSALGTSKPAKYVVLRDDLRLSPDDMQKMCFVLCYNSIRTRGVLAIPTPVRYADLCAYRSKLHVEAQRDIVDMVADKEQAVDLETAIIRKLNEMVQLNETIRNRLYYC